MEEVKQKAYKSPFARLMEAQKERHEARKEKELARAKSSSKKFALSKI